MSTNFTATVFDGDPDKGATAWPDYDGVVVVGYDGQDVLRRVLEDAVRIARDTSGYCPEDRLWVHVWDHNGCVTHGNTLVGRDFQECCCTCGCGAEATSTDETGMPVCGACATYCLDHIGTVVCGHMTDEFSKCHECGESVQWSGICTGRTGEQNYRSGYCGCGFWTQRENGGSWDRYEFVPRREIV